MNLFALDISGSISKDQIIKGCNIIEERFKDGDLIAIFSHNSAKIIKFYEIGLVLKHKTIQELQRSLYGKRKRIIGFGMCGSKLAAEMAEGYNKICLTDGYITDDEASKYEEIVKI